MFLWAYVFAWLVWVNWDLPQWARSMIGTADRDSSVSSLSSLVFVFSMLTVSVCVYVCLCSISPFCLCSSLVFVCVCGGGHATALATVVVGALSLITRVKLNEEEEETKRSEVSLLLLLSLIIYCLCCCCCCRAQYLFGCSAWLLSKFIELLLCFSLWFYVQANDSKRSKTKAERPIDWQAQLSKSNWNLLGKRRVSEGRVSIA